jgi:hypothetical protein
VLAAKESSLLDENMVAPGVRLRKRQRHLFAVLYSAGGVLVAALFAELFIRSRMPR